MAKHPLGKGTNAGNSGANYTANHTANSTVTHAANHTVNGVNVEELTRKARYIVDEAGRKQAIVLDWAVWQDFLGRIGSTVTPATTNTAVSNTPLRPASATSVHVHDPEYTLYRDASNVDIYRPQPASNKEAADFRLESNVTRRPRE